MYSTPILEASHVVPQRMETTPTAKSALDFSDLLMLFWPDISA
jgi:hypothetical protein